MERAFTALHVLFRRWMGAVPKAEMIDVSVEKLFSWRHFYIPLAVHITSFHKSTYVCHVHKVLYDNDSPFHILLG
jgi:hypothetical protein